MQGGGGFVPIVEHQGEDPQPMPVPPNYPVPNTPPTTPPPNNPSALPQTNTSDTYTYDLAIGSQGDFSEVSANYEFAINVVVKKVNGVVTETRPLNANEVVKGKFMDRGIRIASTDPSYGQVKHGKRGTLKFTDMSGTPVQITLKRIFPVSSTENTFKIDFIVP
jgi:hypothetical protein